MKAFPTNVTKSSGGDGWKTDYGMDLRDYFAAKALQGLLTRPVEEFLDAIDGTEKVENYVARISYGMADAMMEAREK
jgi:hypothetical protein